MAAKVVLISEENWPIIKQFLADCEDAAIVLSPDSQAKLAGHPVLDRGDRPIEYTWDYPQTILFCPLPEEVDKELFDEHFSPTE